MKRFFLAIGITFLLLAGYLAITSVIVVLSGYDRNTLAFVQTPVRLPQTVFYHFSPPTAEDYQLTFTKRKAILTGLSFVLNIFLYLMPVYFILGLISKFRKSKPAPTNEPPPPPSF